LYEIQSAEGDILVRQELEGLVQDFPDRFSLHYTLSKPPSDWKYSSGYVSKETIEKYCLFNNSSKNTQVFMCGPPLMIKNSCLPNLKELGFTDKELVAF
jgi:NAD(P)H-flavin reductase